jgi:zinc/manganese transport system substrate-binding protein
MVLRIVGTWVMALALVAVGGGCVRTASPAKATASAGTGKTLHIVAGENIWGSIVAQLAGRAGTVLSVVNDPNADPHDYEASSDDARAFATADYVLLNGAGYDTWANKLLSGNPNRARKVTVVADVVGKKEGDNPHFWYNPAFVATMTNRIEADLKALDPGDAAYFDGQREAFDEASQPYRQSLATIKAHFSGTSVGATESIFVYLANYLGLNLISPPSFMQAVSEGNDPPAATVGQFQDQITHRLIKVLAYNRQTANSVTSNLQKLAAQRGIPAVGVTETIEPSTASFEQWQAGQLQQLDDALTAGSVP